MKYTLYLVLIILLPGIASGQCGIGTPLIIPAQGINYANFRIDNAVNNDLSNPNQGICSISARFSHSLIGDLRLLLSTPNGRQYVLISNGGSRSTTGTTWDITFVPCSTPASPDQGNFIKPVWDSDQDWGQNNTYTGTYHTEACLEDINSGPVNGIWSLTVLDQRGENAGVLESFTIDFCNDVGVTCSECVRLGGRINLDTVFSCGGDPNLGSIRIFPTYSGPEPDPSLYTYRFVVVANGTILDITTRPDLTGQPQGDYLIYGLSIANRDLTTLDGFNGGPFGALSTALNPGRLQICGAYASGFKVYRILSDPSPLVEIQRFVCPQTPIQFNNQTITSPGIYEATFTSASGCDSMVRLTVTAFDVTQNIVNPGSISCGNKPLTLQWPNQFASKPNYRWSTEDGSILSNPFADNIQVDLPGQYQLIVARDGCADTLTTDVLSDGSLPTLDIRDVVMDCSANIGELRPLSNATRFSWTGPNGFTATTQNIDVTEPGSYTITATGAACLVRKTIQVSADFQKPEDIQVMGGSIKCAQDTVQLMANSTSPGVAYRWSGPGGFISIEQNPRVTEPGIYTVQIGASFSGCTVQESVEVANLFAEPSINITGTTLDCAGLAKNIVMTVSDPLATFAWTGPNGFTSTSRTPRVSEPGDYHVTITDAQQCNYQNMVTVDLDTVMPVVNTTDITLNCMETDFTLSAISSSAHTPTFTWTGPGNYFSNLPSPNATQAGTYFITVRDPVNNCRATASLTVSPDPQQPTLRTENGVINCAQSQDTLVVEPLDNCPGGCGFTWSGPGGFSSNDSSIIVSQGGVYEVEVVATTGCVSKATFNVPMNTTPIKPNVVVTDIGCTTDGSIILANHHLFPQYEWFDTVSMVSQVNTRSFVSSSPTFVQLKTTDRNGCLDSLEREINITDDIPRINILVDTIDCAKDTVSIGVSLDNYANWQIASYDWTLPDGSSTSTVIPRVGQTGSISLDVVMRNGCSGSATSEISNDFSTPDLMAIGGGFRCSEPGVMLDFSTEGTPLLTSWTGPGGFQTTESRPLAQQPGMYHLQLLGPNGCEAFDSTMVVITDPLPTLEVSGDTVTCLDTLTDLTFTTNAAAGYSFFWLDPGGRIKNDVVVQTVLPGPYLIELTDTNGCRTVTEVRVAIDTATIGQRVTSDVLDCTDPSTQIKLDSIYSFLDYTWYFDSLEISKSPEPTVATGGLYRLETTNVNGCVRTTLHVVEADTVSPRFMLPPDTLDCTNNRIAIRPTATDPTWSYAWTGPGNFTSAIGVTVVNQPGIYQLQTRSRNGCQHVETVAIEADFDAPDLSIQNTFIPCNGNQARLQFETDDTLAEVNWFGPNGFYDNMVRTRTSEAGQYFILAKGFNGCEILDSMLVSADPLLDPPVIDSLHIDCAQPEGFLAIVNPDSAFMYSWQDAMQNVTTDSIVQSLTGGTFLLEARHIFSDCVLAQSFNINIDTVTPLLSIVERDSIICTHREISLGSETSRPVYYSWSTPDGRILGRDDLADIRLDLPGQYDLLVRDTLNQCENSAQIEITEKPNNLNGFSVLLEAANCDGLNDGIILVDTIFGGSAPFQFSLGGEFYSSRNAYQFLAPDEYLVVVQDVNGCSADTLVTIDRDPRFQIDLGEDVVIDLGDSVLLAAEISLAEEDLAQILWLQPSDIFCNDCREQSVSPLRNTHYSVQVDAVSGCTIRDTILVRVASPEGIFVPNGFTPNGDNINDFAELFADHSIDQIQSYEIFDRWGNNVFSVFNFEPGSLDARWDGTYRGKELGPGVFIYVVKAVDIRGDTQYKMGDITLLR